MLDVAGEFGVAIFDPEDINSPQSVARLAEAAADVLVVCDYGQILSKEALATARFGGINVHGSLLPRYRGAAPINWAIYHGEILTGVTVIHMTADVDAGPCIAQASTPIDADETAVELEARLCQMGAPLVRQALDHLESGDVEALPQDPAQASRAPRLRKTDGLVDWSRQAGAIRNQVRALEPWPKTYTFWHRPTGPPMRLILGRVSVSDASDPATPPGTVLEAPGDRIVVAAGDGAVVLETLQPAGKRLLEVRKFLRGYHVQPGERFGPE